MTFTGGLLAVCLAGSPAGSGTGSPSPERVVFHTAAGDLVFGLDPTAAPASAAQFLRLARAGVYDGTSIARIHPGFIVQVGAAQSRVPPMSGEQLALLKKLPLELSNLRHVRGSLSLAHPDDDPNGGESSFCIMLGPAPHLDGKYTVFGKLLAGEGVLAELLEVPVTAQLTPTLRVSVDRVDVYETAADLSHVFVVPPHPVAGIPKLAPLPPTQDPLMIAGLFLVALLAAAAGLLRTQLSASVTSSLSLVVLLLAAFMLLALLGPEGQHRPWLATTLFFGLILVFRALGRFEQTAGR